MPNFSRSSYRSGRLGTEVKIYSYQGRVCLTDTRAAVQDTDDEMKHRLLTKMGQHNDRWWQAVPVAGVGSKISEVGSVHCCGNDKNS